MKTKKAKRIRNLLLIILVIPLWLIGTVYSDHATARLESRHLVYEPFSGKLFDLDPREVKWVFVRRCCEKEDSLLTEQKNWSQLYETPEEIAGVLEQLNSFRFWFWMPETYSYRKEAGFECPIFSIVFKDERDITGILRENRLWVGEFLPPKIHEAKGAWYYGGRELYDALMALE